MSGKQRKKRDQRILATFEKTGSIRATARKLGHSINTVRKVLRGQDTRRRITSQPARPSKLDPYRPTIKRLVLDDKLTAILVLEDIQEIGYDGGYSILKSYIRQFRPSPALKVTTTIEHPPGAEGQVDWSPYLLTLGREQRVVRCFSCVLPFSRYMYVRFAFNEKLETLTTLHDEAFEDIGGIPKLMSYDNMTTVGRHTGPGKIWINPRFDAYRKECGNFDIFLIDPGKPNQHASVERPFHYIWDNCLRRRRYRFDDLDDLNRHAQWWCDEVANVRIHGTTRERPVDRLHRERPLLLPLPSMRPKPYRELARKVGSDFCVRLDTNRYSVHPRHVGQPATLHEYDDRIEILIGGNMEAVHVPLTGRHRSSFLPEHEEAFKRCTPSRRLLEQAFLRLGEAAKDYYDGLRGERGRGAGYHLQRILKLADRHGSAVVTGAMAHAARFGNYSADAVARVIAGREISPRPRIGTTGTNVPPERVRRWLEGIDVEGSDLSEYDRLIDELDSEQGADDDEG